MFQNEKQKILNLYQKYESSLDISFFIGGFIFDVLFMSDIDDLFSLGQQTLYLSAIAFFIHHEVLFRLQKWHPSKNLFEKVWTYRNLLLHFLLGSLLSLYSLFYIKSSSFISSLFFLIVMIALLIANELPVIKKASIALKVGLYAICLFSFISILFPIILGFVGWVPFGLSVLTTLAILYLQVFFLKKELSDVQILFKTILIPSFSVLTAFAIFYVLGWIPPVPLSIKEQGIYHLVEKKEGIYFLSTEKAKWKFWLSGDQDFKARPQDKIYFYAQIYSPTRFSDQIYIQWLRKDPIHGWQKTDRIPLQILGGRKEGFRGYAVKSNYQPGEWRVQVETSMGHEISRLNFEVTTVISDEPRNFTVLTR